ncbi:PilZ domain-containing protein [Paenibacillus mendelii]|uniref:PilZ domain-containing protein n=1 Tax=Paenibacillus mendelii TaxID=206163 RepID=A0ABV6JJB7_9BACL|nr:PilZ domain-containing protein [Paenibacillus mendelii]MCQ6558822.1 PilZ domain-containing protein [Paenibacillus mendelii]
MTNQAGSSGTGWYGMVNTSFPLKALLHSRTVVEKDGYVSTGVLTHIEGDMLEVEMTEFKNFELGNPVHLTVYSPVGIHRVQSTIIGKAEGSLAVLFPPRAFSGLEEKRESTRVEMLINGSFRNVLRRQIQTSEGSEILEVEEWIEFTVRNASLAGLGFEVISGPQLHPADKVEAIVKTGFDLHCTLEIVHSKSGGDHTFYGARFEELGEQERRALRAFLLREQIAVYYRMKQIK